MAGEMLDQWTCVLPPPIPQGVTGSVAEHAVVAVRPKPWTVAWVAQDRLRPCPLSPLTPCQSVRQKKRRVRRSVRAILPGGGCCCELEPGPGAHELGGRPRHRQP